VLLDQDNEICAFPAVAARLAGAVGAIAGAVGVALTSVELALSPEEFNAETT
jgi:hypothetical protein